MAVWLLIVVVAQFLNAVVAVVDKYIVSSPVIARPSLYAFYVSILSASAVLVFLFSGIPIPIEGISIPNFENVAVPPVMVLGISLLAGLALFGALTGLFSALKRADASDVIPVTGAASAVSALVLSYLFLDASLTQGFAWGFVLLVAGTLILSNYRFWYKTLWFSLGSGFLFGAHFVCLKLLFIETNFDDAFFWSRVGIVAIALLFLLLPKLRRQCVAKTKEAGKKIWFLIIGNKVLAGLASIMLLKAIELGDVSIVQALGGLQFVYLLGFTIFFGRELPQLCGEKCTRKQLVQKTVAVAVILAGFALLFL